MSISESHPEVTTYIAVFKHPPTDKCDVANPRSRFNAAHRGLRALSRYEVAKTIIDDREYPRCSTCESRYVLKEILPISEFKK